MNFDAEAVVRDLTARREICDAVYRYMRGQDRLGPELYRSAFHDDARVDRGLMSDSAFEFVEFARRTLGDLGGSQHIIGQARSEIVGDRASGEVDFYG